MPAQRIRFLLVDGHSMIFAWDDLRAMHERRGAMARDELCQRLQTHQDVSGERVVVVFDGSLDSAAETDPVPGAIQVIYSKRDGSADEILERLACKYAPNHDLTVASRDRAVLDMCSSFGAHAISANGLADLVENSERRFREENREHFR